MQSEANEKYPEDASMSISCDASSTAMMSFFPSERVRMLTVSERMISETATDADIATTLPKLPLNDISAIADFVMNTLQLQDRPC